MRRSLALIASAVLIAVAVAAVALAFESSGGSSASTADRGGSTEPAHARGGRHGMGFGPLRMLLNGLAERLEVTPEDLREAIHGVKRRGLDRAVEEGVISEAERDALADCMPHGRGADCDRAAARSALRKLHREHRRRGRAGLVDLKENILGDLAAELGKPVDEVTAAVRAELVEGLDRAVAMGFLSRRGRRLALRCFDEPGSCRLRALRREAFGRFGHRHGPRRGP